MQKLHSTAIADTVTDMETSTWIAQLTDESVREIAKRTGISERTLHHQVSNNRMSLENLVKIAVAYNHHPLRTLIEWGIVDQAWEKVPDVKAALRVASEDELAEEVVRRLVEAKELKRATALDTPINELAAKRSTASTPDVSPVNENDDVLYGIDPSQYAAHPKTDPLDEDNPTP